MAVPRVHKSHPSGLLRISSINHVLGGGGVGGGVLNIMSWWVL